MVSVCVPVCVSFGSGLKLILLCLCVGGLNLHICLCSGVCVFACACLGLYLCLCILVFASSHKHVFVFCVCGSFYYILFIYLLCFCYCMCLYSCVRGGAGRRDWQSIMFATDAYATLSFQFIKYCIWVATWKDYKKKYIVYLFLCIYISIAVSIYIKHLVIKQNNSNHNKHCK